MGEGWQRCKNLILTRIDSLSSVSNAQEFDGSNFYLDSQDLNTTEIVNGWLLLICHPCKIYRGTSSYIELKREKHTHEHLLLLIHSVITLCMTSTSCLAWNGLQAYASIPASKHLSLYPWIAWAVRPMIGFLDRFCCDSSARIIFVAWRPSRTGICTSQSEVDCRLASLEPQT